MKTQNSFNSLCTDERGRFSVRKAVLEAAGRVFAERGFAQAMGKDICQLAGVTSSAVNYYFGGKEKLYLEVLQEAHRRVCDLEELDKIVQADLSPQQKLRALLAMLLHFAFDSEQPWHIRVLLRELSSPSTIALENLPELAEMKILRIRLVLQELTGFAEDSKQLQWLAGFVIAPCTSLIIFPERLRSLLIPTDGEETDAIVDYMYKYIMGGIQAVQNMAQQSHSNDK